MYVSYLKFKYGTLILSTLNYPLQAHFDETAFISIGNKIKLRKASAFPTLSASLISEDSESDAENQYPASLSVSLPHYSCPALEDHNYANFKSPEIADYMFFNEPVSEPVCVEEIVEPIETMVEEENLPTASESTKKRSFKYV